MATGTSGLGTRKETAKMTPGDIDTGIGTGNMLEMKSQASSRLRIRKRSSLYQTKSYLETKPPLWRGIPG